MTTTDIFCDPALDGKVRRAVRRVGWRACKSRDRSLHHNNQGGWKILDYDNSVIYGVDYDCSDREVLDVCEEKLRRTQANQAAA
jgi:hypothetical protein